jgi:hypothetical protein
MLVTGQHLIPHHYSGYGYYDCDEKTQMFRISFFVDLSAFLGARYRADNQSYGVWPDYLTGRHLSDVRDSVFPRAHRDL